MQNIHVKEQVLYRLDNSDYIFIFNTLAGFFAHLIYLKLKLYKENPFIIISEKYLFRVSIEDPKDMLIINLVKDEREKNLHIVNLYFLIKYRIF